MSSQKKNPAARAGANRVTILAGVKTSPANLIERRSDSLSALRLRRHRRLLLTVATITRSGFRGCI